MKMLALSGMLLITAACNNDPNYDPPRLKEFVCYDDGKVTEHHVQVASAYKAHFSNSWEIQYGGEGSTGEWHSYLPRPGETCGME